MRTRESSQEDVVRIGGLGDRVLYEVFGTGQEIVGDWVSLGARCDDLGTSAGGAVYGSTRRMQFSERNSTPLALWFADSPLAVGLMFGLAAFAVIVADCASRSAECAGVTAAGWTASEDVGEARVPRGLPCQRQHHAGLRGERRTDEGTAR
jgi:hypothetical protein